LRVALGRSFESLSVPNYRRYFAGQLVSISGNWMQIVAEMWLILQLTGNGVAVGVTSALQFLPILLFGAWGGVLADRIPKRRLLIVTQSLMALPALALWGVTSAGVVTPALVFALVFARGAVNAIDNPTRQSFVMEMVGADRVVNAVSLNSVLIHCARIVGPAAAGATIATIGVGPCFLVNALSFVAMIVALRSMDGAQLDAAPPAPREPGAVRAGLAYVLADRSLAIPMAMMALVGMLGFNFQVILPLLADFTFDGGAGAYTGLAAAMAVGSVLGALASGARGRVGPRLLVADPAARGPRPRAPRGGERHLRRRGQLLAPAWGRPDHARARDVALLDRLPRLHPDRGADRRLALPDREPARRPLDVGCRRADGGRRRLVRVRAPPARIGPALRRTEEPPALASADGRAARQRGVVAVGARAASDRGRGRACGRASPARARRRARRRSEPRRAPRSR
jgi:MFS family permease